MSEPRAIQAVVSKYQRNRVWQGSFLRGDVFSLGVNLNGCLAAGATIAAITFRVQNPQTVIFGSLTKNTRNANVVCTLGFGPGTAVKAVATDSNGKVWTQGFFIEVLDSPFFMGEVIPPPGPYPYSVSAP